MATVPRFTPGTNQDNTLRVVTQDYQTPIYAASLAIIPVQERTKVNVGQLTGNTTITIATVVGNTTPIDPALTTPLAGPFVGDIAEFLFGADGSNRTITFSTGFSGLASLVVNSATFAYTAFMFNGTSWVYMTATGFAAVAPTILTPAYASSIAITTNARSTTVIPGQLTGALTVTVVTSTAVEGDKLDFLFSNDSTQRIVTFSTNFVADSTIVLPPSTNASVSFIYNGTSYVQTGQLRTLTDDVQTPAYAATVSVTTTHRKTKLIPALLTGALTINAVVTNAIAGDELACVFISDSGGEVVTYGTNFKSAGTQTLNASKWGGSAFVFNGTFWVETGRAISA